MALYTCVLYPAQENLAEEKPIRTLNCKKVVRGQCCLLTKREALLSFFHLFFLLFIYLFLSSIYRLFLPVHPYIFFLFFLFTLLYSVPLVMSRYRFVTREWLHEYFVTCLL